MTIRVQGHVVHGREHKQMERSKVKQKYPSGLTIRDHHLSDCKCKSFDRIHGSDPSRFFLLKLIRHLDQHTCLWNLLKGSKVFSYKGLYLCVTSESEELACPSGIPTYCSVSSFKNMHQIGQGIQRQQGSDKIPCTLIFHTT